MREWWNALKELMAPKSRTASYHVIDRWGMEVDAPTRYRMEKVLADLRQKDAEHSDTWLTHDSGWQLTVDESRVVSWSHRDAPAEARHMSDVSIEQALKLWIALADGRLDEVDAHPWQPGPSP